MVVQPLPEWRANIGWIKPGPVTKGIDHFFQVTPKDVNFVISTTLWSLKLANYETFDPASIADSISTMAEMASELMGYEDLDYVTVTGDLFQSAMGVEWNESLRDAVATATGRPAATAMTAAVDALRHVGARRIAVATPVTEVKNASVKRYLESCDFEVLAVEGNTTRSSREIRGLPIDAPYQGARRAFERASGADALYLPSLTWRATEYAAQLERELGVPVITLYNSMVWHALRAVSYPGSVTGYGSILEG